MITRLFYIIFESFILFLAVVLVGACIRKRKIPYGIIDWAVLIAAASIIASWVMR